MLSKIRLVGKWRQMCKTYFETVLLNTHTLFLIYMSEHIGGRRTICAKELPVLLTTRLQYSHIVISIILQVIEEGGV